MRAGTWRLAERIGGGGFGDVYRARDDTGRAAAVKVLSADLSASPEAVARFTREITAVRRVRHPGLAEIYDAGTADDGRPYFAMELLRGADLGRVLSERGRLPAAEVVDLIDALAAALAAAHALSVIHRDVKASNVFVCDDDARVVLLDFGIAKLADDDGAGLTRSRQTVGSLCAMAPEQLAGGPIDARVDVYALGALAYHALVGELPFFDESVTVMRQLHRYARRRRPSERSGVPATADAVVVRAMSTDPARRHPDAPAFAAALRHALGKGSGRADDGPAVAVAVDVAVDVDDDADDATAAAALAAVDRVLCAAREHFGARGFSPAIEAARSALYVASGGDDDTPARAAAGFRALAARLAPGDLLRVEVRTHAGPAALRDGRAVGGALLDLGAWPSARSGG
jgi:eukaryotic-like serine/threonine-protein kinase